MGVGQSGHDSASYLLPTPGAPCCPLSFEVPIPQDSLLHIHGGTLVLICTPYCRLWTGGQSPGGSCRAGSPFHTTCSPDAERGVVAAGRSGRQEPFLHSLSVLSPGSFFWPPGLKATHHCHPRVSVYMFPSVSVSSSLSWGYTSPPLSES